MTQLTQHRLLTAGICASWAAISVAPILKYFSHTLAGVSIVLGIISIAIGVRWLEWHNRSRPQISSLWLGAVFVLLAAAFIILYPISLKHVLNIGSDREDALRIELTAIRNHEYPYAARTFLGNPPTPLPGSMLLAAPFWWIGHIAWQNFFWLFLFILFLLQFFHYRATGALFVTVFVLLSPGTLSDFTSGGDYLTNYYYVAIALVLFVASLERPFLIRILAALFLGLTLSSRIIYWFALIPLMALALQRTSRSRSWVMFITTLGAAAAITLPVFGSHPFQGLMQQLSQNAVKLRYIPSILHAELTLPLLAVSICCASFFIRMNLPRLFLILSSANLIVLAPFVATFALHSAKLGYSFFYLSVCSLSFSLWALTQFECKSKDLSTE